MAVRERSSSLVSNVRSREDPRGFNDFDFEISEKISSCSSLSPSTRPCQLDTMSLKALWNPIALDEKTPNLARSSHGLAQVGNELILFGGELKPRTPVDGDVLVVKSLASESNPCRDAAARRNTLMTVSQLLPKSRHSPARTMDRTPGPRAE